MSKLLNHILSQKSKDYIMNFFFWIVITLAIVYGVINAVGLLI